MTLACGACKKEFILHNEPSKETVVTCENCGKKHKVKFSTKLAYSELICGCGTHIYFEGKGGYRFYPDNKRYDAIMKNRARERQDKRA
jgi:DNA-directed RNA polymerase subunit RPC12/RpoP